MTADPYPPHPRTPYPPAIINAALTGQVLTPARAPYLPITPEAIAEDAAACAAAGATIVHLHARDAQGRPDWRPETYRRVVAAVRERCPDLVVCVSTSGRDEQDPERRAAVLGLTGDDRPDMASLTLGSFNFHGGPSLNAPATIELLAGRMADAGIVPELEIFDVGMAHAIRRLQERGLLPAAPYANLLLGFGTGAPATARSLVAVVDALPGSTTWAAAGLGDYQHPVHALALAMGGHVRAGLEDNPAVDVDGAPMRNVDLVRRAARLATEIGRRLASPAETRALLGLPAAVR
jgi:uncharacterized protein (DUF849 family)